MPYGYSSPTQQQPVWLNFVPPPKVNPDSGPPQPPATPGYWPTPTPGGPLPGIPSGLPPVLPPSPMITVYAPTRNGARWTARADVNAYGELIELEASASQRVADKLRDLYSNASELAHQWIRYEPYKRSSFGAGVRSYAPRALELQTRAASGAFGALPAIALEVGASFRLPYQDDVRQAADLLSRAAQGDIDAANTIIMIGEAAQRGDRDAGDAIETLDITHDAMTRPERIALPAAMRDARAGHPPARKVLSALREAVPQDEPIRVEWAVDDYIEAGDDVMTADVLAACADELQARICDPWFLFTTGGRVPVRQRGKARVLRRVGQCFEGAMAASYYDILAGC